MKRFNQNEKEETQYPLFLITILAFFMKNLVFGENI